MKLIELSFFAYLIFITVPSFASAPSRQKYDDRLFIVEGEEERSPKPIKTSPQLKAQCPTTSDQAPPSFTLNPQGNKLTDFTPSPTVTGFLATRLKLAPNESSFGSRR